jgi:hypothetical protein
MLMDQDMKIAKILGIINQEMERDIKAEDLYRSQAEQTTLIMGK